MGDTFKELLKSETVQSLLKYFTSGRFVITLLAIIISVGLVITTSKLARFYLRKQREINGSHMGQEKVTLLHVMASVLTSIIILITVIFILQINGLEVSSLITSVSIISAIIGLALQDTIKDIIQGIQILSDRFFMVGDVVKIDGYEGKVTRFTIRATKIVDIRTFNEITISNRNISKIERSSDRHFIDVPVSYEEPVEKMFIIFPDICSVLDENEEIRESAFLGLKSIGDSAMIYQIRINCSPENSPRIIRAANKVIVEELAKRGVSIPYNQLDVHYDVIGKQKDSSLRSE